MATGINFSKKKSFEYNSKLKIFYYYFFNIFDISIISEACFKVVVVKSTPPISLAISSILSWSESFVTFVIVLLALLILFITKWLSAKAAIWGRWDIHIT